MFKIDYKKQSFFEKLEYLLTN